MERKTMTVCKLEPSLEFLNSECLFRISPNLRTFFTRIKTQELLLYVFSSNDVISSRSSPVLRYNNVHNAMYSEDGKLLFIILESRTFQVLQLEQQKPEVQLEISLASLQECFSGSGIGYNGECSIVPLKLSQRTLALLINQKWLSILRLPNGNKTTLSSAIEIPQFECFCTSKHFLHCLNSEGRLFTYSLEDARKVAVYDLQSVMPSITSMGTWKMVAASEDNSMVAIIDDKDVVYFINIKDINIKKLDFGDSTMSASSEVSYSSFQTSITMKSSYMDSVSISASSSKPIQKPKPVTCKTLWNMQLDKLQNRIPCKTDRSGYFKEESHRKSKYNRRLEFSPVQMISAKQDHCIRSIVISPMGVSVWYSHCENPSSAGGLYAVFDPGTGICIAEEILPDDSIMVLGGFMGMMDAILSPTSIKLCLCNITKDVLVNKLLQCVGTEPISRLLRGDEQGDLMIPLPALMAGLRQHQLEVARLALHSQVQAFKSAIVKNLSEDMNMWHRKINEVCIGMDQLFSTLIHAVQDNMNNITFAEQLVVLSLDSTYEILQCLHDSEVYASTSSTDVSGLYIDEITSATKIKVMNYIVQLRSYLYHHPRDTTTVLNYEPLSCVDTSLKVMWSTWDHISEAEVIQEAILANTVPFAQVFFTTYKNWSESKVQGFIQKVVEDWTHDLLRKRNIEMVQTVLKNVGYNSSEKLKEICLNSVDKELRDYLVHFLMENMLLSEEEQDAWKFLQKIEDFLPSIKTLENREFCGSVLEYHTDVPPYEFPIPCGKGKISIQTILSQATEWKDRVFVDLFFAAGESDLQTVLKPDVVWRYLLKHNSEEMLFLWIDSKFAQKSVLELAQNDMQETALVESDREVGMIVPINSAESRLLNVNIRNVFAVWPISQEMVDEVHTADCMQNTKDAVLDRLSLYGVFSSREKEKIWLILLRIMRTRNLSDLESAFVQSSSNVSKDKFYDLLTNYCLQHNLFNVLFHFIEQCDFSSELCASLQSNVKQELCELYKTFQQLLSNPSDKVFLQNAIVNSARYLSRKQYRGDIKAYINDHPLLVLAVILFSETCLQDILTSDLSQDKFLNKDALQNVVSRFPVLRFAFQHENAQSTPQCDITVYELLDGCSPFDISKLFGWQEMHRNKGDDTIREFPHFSQEMLVAKYGHRTTMTYLDYLKQGRPVFAANLCLIDQYKSHGRLSKKMRNHACNCAHGLALQKFGDSNITAACISFVEMLGGKSETLRIHILAANKILSSKEGKKICERKVGSLMYGLVSNKQDAAEQVLAYLEEALPKELPKCDLDSVETIMEMLKAWCVAVKFARIHNLKLPEVFVKECARKDNWFLFIVFLQLYQYPLKQAVELVKEFKSKILEQHLRHAFIQDTEEKQKPTEDQKLKPRDYRRVLYSTIKVNMDDESISSRSTSSSSRTESLASSLISSNSSEDSFPQLQATSYSRDDLAVDLEPQDLFSTLLTCHGSQDPPRALLSSCISLRNPIFAVLAACYEPSSILSCFCTWLLTSFVENVLHDATSKVQTALQQQLWSARDVEFILNEALRTGHVTTLVRAFRIFLPENPLCAFTEFLEGCVVKKHFEESILKLKLFKASCINLPVNPTITDVDDKEGTFLANQHWIASMAVKLTCSAVSNCFSSSYHQLKFLEALHQSAFNDQLPVDAPDFYRICLLQECLSDTDVKLNCSMLLEGKSSVCERAELRHCLNLLIQKKCFEQALKFANAAGLPKDSIVVAKWSFDFHNASDELKSENSRVEFWYACDKAFRDEDTKADVAAGFFQDHSKKIQLYNERYHVLKLALEWLRKSTNDDDDKNPFTEESTEYRSKHSEEESIELEMWKCQLRLSTDEEVISNISSQDKILLKSLKTEVLEMSGMKNLQTHIILNNEQEISRLNALIGSLLDKGHLSTAVRLKEMFSHEQQDLEILLTCMALAEEEITPYKLTTKHRAMLEYKKSHGRFVRRLSRPSLRISTSSTASQFSAVSWNLPADYVEIPSREKQDALMTLDKFVDVLEHGKDIGKRIIVSFRVSMNTDKTYKEIITHPDPIELLKICLRNDCINKFDVAQDLMCAAQISVDDITELLCEEIVAAVSRGHMQGKSESPSSSRAILWGSDLGANFHIVLQLAEDPSLLGNKLLSVANRFGASHPEGMREVHVVVVELLIRAHDCYTADCNMEGISQVLKKARTLITSLTQNEEWGLMVRLLTGVGRYTDMKYVFQILKEHEQLESLLGKGMDKVPGLKLALLEFLKQHHPDDRELFRIVALHFLLYSEVAQIWEAEAKTGIHRLLEVTHLELSSSESSTQTHPVLVNSEDSKLCLNLAMQNFVHAAEYYLEANKVKRAQSCAHQAELVALQLSFLNTVQNGQSVECLLELNTQQVTYLVTNKLSFPQASIVTRAYNHQTDWSAALYQHFVVQHEVSYFTDLTQVMILSSTMVEDAVRRFQREKNISHEMVAQMKILINSLSSVDVKYRLASQLCFKDILEVMLSGSDHPYLKDVVWKRGYN